MTAVVFGVWPALQLSRPDLARVTQATARRVMGSAQERRTHRVMVAVQVALTLLMLTVAGAAGKGFLRLANADLGYDPQNAMSLPIPVHDGTYKTWKERSEYFERLRAAVAAMPNVEAAGISTNATPPANGGDNTMEILGGDAQAKPIARANYVSSEYFPLLRIPVAGGRLWSRDEIARGAPLAVDQPDDGAAVLPQGRRRGTAVPDRQHEGRAALLAGVGRRRRLDRDRGGRRRRAQRRAAQSHPAGVLRAVHAQDADVHAAAGADAGAAPDDAARYPRRSSSASTASNR